MKVSRSSNGSTSANSTRAAPVCLGFMFGLYCTRTGTKGPPVPPARPIVEQGLPGSLAAPRYSSHIFCPGPPLAPALIGCSSSRQATRLILTGVDDEFGIGQSTIGAGAILRLAPTVPSEPL